MPTLRFPSLKRYLIRLVQNVELIKSKRVWSFDDQLIDVEVMTVLLEDRRYFLHLGFDPKSMIRAAVGLMTGRRLGGGSTIEMQLVRTVSGLRAQTFTRKFNELVMGTILSFHMSKGSILRTYMSVAYYGTGLTGVKDACLKVYGKTADQLDFDEAAIVAAMLVYPRPANPSTWEERINRRANYGKILYSRYEKRFQQLRVSD